MKQSIPRRSFLARLGAGIGAVGATVASPPVGLMHAAGTTPWRSALHAQDDWFDRITGQHRFVFDTTKADSLALALQYADTYFTANRDAYGLKDSDLAVVIIARHRSTPFGYKSEIWANYGKQLSEEVASSDPKTNEPFSNAIGRMRDHIFTRVSLRNVYADPSNGAGPGLMRGLINKGVHFAVCETATRRLCGSIARTTGAKADAIFNEFASNLLPNAHLVPAGIVAVNRAQERGYSCVCIP